MGRFVAWGVLLALPMLAHAQGFRLPDELIFLDLPPDQSASASEPPPEAAPAEFKDERNRDLFRGALTAFRNGRFEQALGMVRPLAERGHREAEYLMGQFLESLPSPTQAQFREAAIWYLRGAHAGLPPAMNNLAALHVDGRGVPVTYSIARHWYQKAADAGFPLAQYNLALMHGRGQGAPRNDALMLHWLRRAASAGLARAQSQLGRLMLEGNAGGGQAEQVAQAAEWLRKAALQSDPQGQLYFALALQRGLGVASDPVAALDWLKRAADQGSPNAQWALGRAYESGAGTPVQPELAFAAYEEAARANHVDALRRIIAAYRDGDLGRPKDASKADFWSLRLRLATRGRTSPAAPAEATLLK
jgi:TPR repeat protein